MKKIIRELIALVWKLLRTFALKWLRDFISRFARIGVLVMVVGLALVAGLVFLLSAC